MKHLSLLFLLLTLTLHAAHGATLGITPRPKSMTATGGTLTLPRGLHVAYGTLGEDVALEAARFVSDLNAATRLQAVATDERHALITLAHDATIAPEGYRLHVGSDGVSVTAATTAGFFYAFQSLRMLMPYQNESATAATGGRLASCPRRAELPLVDIDDAPRFAYRGFMLDVSRHFFSVDEIKRLVDVMATYKMNRFHWHLTDDQGWRAEIKRYPRLTTVGATAARTRITPLHGKTYWTTQPYGPHFYTQDDMREVVRYCRERHIEVVPEVDMPGHFVAALAAYPEYSCTPDNPPTVWTDGGVSPNVLNVSDPAAMRFVKDILDELTAIFPYPAFHIGGDECPTTQWENHEGCRQRVQELGLKSFRALQSRFIHEISGYLAAKGRRTMMWNESITAHDADLDMVKAHNPIIFCWAPCQAGAAKAAQMGLEAIVTEFHSQTNGLGGGYYINRRLAPQGEPDGAGRGDDSVEGCYAYVPVPANVSDEAKSHYTGVQATFWTEWVAETDYLEYLALPRLMAVAEAGWTPQELKDFPSFRERMARDTVMLRHAGLEYSRHMYK